MKQSTLESSPKETRLPEVDTHRIAAKKRRIAGVLVAILLGAAVLVFFAGEAAAPPKSKSVPPKRWLHAMAYDSESDRIVLFGGIDSPRVFGDTWAYNLNTNTWTNMNPITAPQGRWMHSMAYDVQSDRIVLFGGTFGDDETWAYDLNTNTWTNMNPVVRPSNRSASAMAYDDQSDRIVIFGGGGFDDTWAYDFNSNMWTNMNPLVRPSPRDHSAIAYDADSDRVILFGGGPLSSLQQDTWAYDFDTNTWTNMGAAAGPSARWGHKVAYDSQSDRVILFGGEVGFRVFVDDTWAYDFNTNTWTNENPAAKPGKRGYHALAYDSQSDRIVLFGGKTDNKQKGISGETWAYDTDTNTWTLK